MISIVILACLISDPKVCRDDRIPLASGWDTSKCAMAAPPHFARWEVQHPKWRVVRWHCQPAAMDDI